MTSEYSVVYQSRMYVNIGKSGIGIIPAYGCDNATVHHTAEGGLMVCTHQPNKYVGMVMPITESPDPRDIIINVKAITKERFELIAFDLTKPEGPVPIMETMVGCKIRLDWHSGNCLTD